jgi:hypothetical protein
MQTYEFIFSGLNKNKISYIVVGGVAVNLHGIPRMTYDIDLLLDFERSNVEKFASLVKTWGFKPRVPVDILDLADPDKRSSWIKNKNMKAFNLVNPAWSVSELDVLIDVPISYTDAKRTASKLKLGKVTVPVISRKYLIKLKQDSGRGQDISDIKYLRMVGHEK